MYQLPKLRKLAPEKYDALRAYPVMKSSTWIAAATGEFFYACQDLTFKVRDSDESEGEAANVRCGHDLET